MKPVGVGILGLGTVGQGALTVLTRNYEEIERRAGRRIQVKRIAVRDLDKRRQIDHTNFDLTDDPSAIVDAPDIDIVIELIGGIDPARQLIELAIQNGKHVITANKELIATHGNELFKLAHSCSCIIAYEAAVCGGIPIIKALREGLSGNRIELLAGIINGTSNYILTGMRNKQCSFQEMLGHAQELGYAEADPTFDIEGIDALHKLAILGAVAFGTPLAPFDSILCEGIGDISYEDIAYADELGFTIKPLSVASRGPNGVEMRVHPSLISTQKLLAKVDGVMNGIVVDGDAVGRTLHYGAGAGGEPTASAVMADLVDIVRSLESKPNQRVPNMGFQPDTVSALPLVPISQLVSANYLRMSAENRAGVLADVTRILGDHGISIESILQKSLGDHKDVLPVVIVTQETTEQNMQDALIEIGALDSIIGKINRIRIENLP